MSTSEAKKVQEFQRNVADLLAQALLPDPHTLAICFAHANASRMRLGLTNGTARAEALAQALGSMPPKAAEI